MSVVAFTVGLGVEPFAIAAEALMACGTIGLTVQHHGDEAARAHATTTSEVAFDVACRVFDAFFADVHSSLPNVEAART